MQSNDECCYLCNECPSVFRSLADLEAHMQRSGVHDSATTSSSSSASSLDNDTVSTPTPHLKSGDNPDEKNADKMELYASMDRANLSSASPTSSSTLTTNPSSPFDSPTPAQMNASNGSAAVAKVYNCRFCERTFPSRDQLNVHYTHTHRDKPQYVCETCNKVFGVKRELSTHLRIHSGEEPHKCQECGKEFGTRQLLKKHCMWHTGERTHICPTCNKAFYQKGHLTQHLMIHRGGRPHQCRLCEKTFIFKFDLNRHIKIHAERSFCCKKCGKSFAKQAHLDEHTCKRASNVKLSKSRPSETSIVAEPRPEGSPFSTTGTSSSGSSLAQVPFIGGSPAGLFGRQQQQPSPMNIEQPQQPPQFGPLSPADVKKEEAQNVASASPVEPQLVTQNRAHEQLARLIQLALAQKQQQQQQLLNSAAALANQQQQFVTTMTPEINNNNNGFLPAASVFTANPTTPQNLAQLAIILQQQQQQLQIPAPPTFQCPLCSVRFDNQISFALHCSLAHSSQTNAMLTNSSQQPAAVLPQLNGASGLVKNDEPPHYESATASSSCASSPQKLSPPANVAADWTPTACTQASHLHANNAAAAAGCADACALARSRCTETEKELTRARGELQRLRELLLGQLTTYWQQQ